MLNVSDPTCTNTVEKLSTPPKSPIPLRKTKDVVFEEQTPKHEGVRICFARFNTADIEECISFIEGKLQKYRNAYDKELGGSHIVHATGGGAYKFASLIRERLGTQIHKYDEMECLISGLNFLLKNLPDESFTYHNEEKHYTSYTVCRLF
jgi:type II pantothenate kinase